MSDEPASRPWWRFVRFSLRGLMVLVLVAGAGLGWYVRSARIQRQAVAAIEQAGGSVAYEWDLQNGKRIANGKPWWPEWLVNLVGVDYFGSVVAVDLIDFGTDELLVDVSKLTRLEDLQLNGSEVTDAGLAFLSGLTKLKHLTLRESKVTDAGLIHLRGLTDLEQLTLGYTACSDAGLRHLRGLPRLKKLGLVNTQVTEAGIASLMEMTNLEVLRLGGRPISDVGLVQLKKLTALKILGLSGTDVTDDGVEDFQLTLPNVQIVR
jgi:internalin A